MGFYWIDRIYCDYQDEEDKDAHKPKFKKPPVSKKIIKHHAKESYNKDYPVFHEEDSPDIDKLMDDFKNYIKLEAWSMALSKANEILHYYPDRPEAEKIRSNLSFLTKKVKPN